MNNKQQWIIGLGTGRCGTKSLSVLLNHQQQTKVTHEMSDTVSTLPWEIDVVRFEAYYAKISNRSHRFVGDVAHYLLPYVDLLLAKQPSVKFVVLQRDKQQTVDSYMLKTRGMNHWSCHNGAGWRQSNWDDCFPKFSGDKEDCIAQYYDLYYDMCRKHLPPDTLWLTTTDMNCESVVVNMLKYCGFTEPKYQQVRANALRS